MTETDNLDIAMWDDILSKQGLGMEAGRLTRVTYGARYYDTAQTHNYQERADNYNVPQIKKGREYAERILPLLAKGLSFRAAAKELGIDWRRAHRSVQRYKKNFRPPTQCSSEDSNVD